jgi:bifunctional UDP-N-acetylglucosamine pyrophosphorylase / glucosamine-1-phosphate N-acetyltransferase
MKPVAVVLAAGEGTRMKSEIPKVAHRILGKPLVRWVVDAAREGGAEHVVTVIGHRADIVEGIVGDTTRALQEEQLGTGHAVICALEATGDLSGPVVVLAGDVPLIRAETIARLIDAQVTSGAACVLLSAIFPDPTGYGRVVRDEGGSVKAIVEHRDLSGDMAQIDEGNVGIYCFDGAALSAHLHRLEASNKQQEYYLTDLIAIFVAEDLGVDAIVLDDPDESHGVNSRVQLAEVGKIMQRRINERHMLAGVTMTDPDLVWIGPDVTIGPDTELLPMTSLLGDTRIGTGVLAGPNSRITDSTVGDGAVIDSSVLVQAEVGPGATVGPVAYLRPGALLGPKAKAGACVEIKNSTVGEGSKVPHLSYIGDATIGAGVNIGAGSITCNYDGINKHRTVIEDEAFIGSDTMLVAPVTIGARSVTAAASAITKDVAPGSLSIERGEQREIAGWADKRRAENDTVSHSTAEEGGHRAEGDR